MFDISRFSTKSDQFRFGLDKCGIVKGLRHFASLIESGEIIVQDISASQTVEIDKWFAQILSIHFIDKDPEKKEAPPPPPSEPPTRGFD